MSEYIITGTGMLTAICTGPVDIINKDPKGVIGRFNYSQKNREEGIPDSISVDSSVVTNYIQPAKLRRVDHFCKMALTAACISIENAGLDKKQLENSGLILVSGFGPVNSICAFKDSFFTNGPIGASPTLFTKSVQNQAASNVATFCNIGGIITTICQQDGAVQSGLLTAITWLEEERVERVIVVAVDELCEVIEYHKKRSGNKAHLGEGAAAVILEKNGIGISSVTFSYEADKEARQINPGSLELEEIIGCFPTMKMTELLFVMQSMKDGESREFFFDNSAQFLSKLKVQKKAAQ